MSLLLEYTLEATSIFIVTGVLLKALHPLALQWKLLDLPHGRKDHAYATPVTGGVAMLAGVLLISIWDLGRSAPTTMVSFSLAAIVLSAVGLWDDRCDVRWYWRILAQIGAALIMIYGADIRVEHLGTLFGQERVSLGVFAVPFTVFATVGIINAVNMIDGADGLAGLLVAAALLMLALAAARIGNSGLARHALLAASAVAAFLLYNMRFPWQVRAKAFMGNAGSALLGLLIAWVCFRLTQNPRYPVAPVLALWLLPVPIIDCLVLTVRRMSQGRSPFSASREHVHHLMQDGGFGPTQCALVLTVASLICGLAADQALHLGVPQSALLIAFIAACVAWYAISARRPRAVALFGRMRRRLGIAHPLHAGAPPVRLQAPPPVRPARVPKR
ncbi:MAG: undecaprenyl/decaprenyl-phosphate alpha-N-acetylglucosaminyl 1-phosphate transferase [Dokdonella sp.]|jgi:UDP-GlcNAc:undecaprenyl-phosphate GlcNAc-1-phosphate transferase|nr:undecaprenyl/decaprenyl-phosphate alpha-N-acetylglucosaminyl 1-phosphate transferase [Dokdonella sp.]